MCTRSHLKSKKQQYCLLPIKAHTHTNNIVTCMGSINTNYGIPLRREGREYNHGGRECNHIIITKRDVILPVTLINIYFKKKRY